MISSLESFRLELKAKGIESVEHPCSQDIPGNHCSTCILGVFLTENGKKIEQYMLSWLTKKYNVISIRQPLPGSLFEYPALRYAQLFSIEHEEPVLYLHTKGAANPRKSQRRIVNMWMHEFVESKKEYEKNLDKYDVLLPYSGPQNITWMNGFIGTPKAFSSLPPIAVFENRFYYEILFKGSDLRFWGRRLTNIQRTDALDTTPLMYQDIHRFSASYTRILYYLHNLFFRIS